MLEKLVIVAIVLGLVAAAVAVVEEDNRWKDFKYTHNCKVVSKESDSIGTQVGSDGKIGTVVIYGKTGYLCDDGITYYR